MSTINVDQILPQSGTVVDVNGLGVKYFNSSVGLGDPFSTLSNLTTGSFNIAVGPYALEDATIGINNVAFGVNSLQRLVDGNQNVAVGNGTLGLSLVSANRNTAIGNGAGFLVSTGYNNVLIGADSGDNITTGNNNITIGFNSNPSLPTTNDSITLGNSAHTVIRAAVTTITSLSDERDKKEIQELPVGLEFVEKLKPVKFVWNDRDEDGKHDIEDFGFIAQDLKAAQEESEAGYLNLVYDENPEKLEASYGKLLPVLVKAIQEMSSEIKSLKEEILILKSK